MADQEKYQVPGVGKGDAALAAARAVVGSIPVAGAAATELFNLLITPPLEKRRTDWMEKVSEALLRLEAAQKIRVADLQNDPAFTDALLEASRAAVSTHQQEKIEALRNAVLNVALKVEPDASRQQMFIRWIDEFTPWHIRLLKFSQNPKAWFEREQKPLPSIYMGAFGSVIEAAFPDIGGRDFYDQVWRELHQRGLVGTDMVHSMTSESGLYQARTSDWGKAFLRFISLESAL